MATYGYFRLDPKKSAHPDDDKISYRKILSAAYPQINFVDDPYEEKKHTRDKFDKLVPNLTGNDLFVVYYLSHLSSNFFWAASLIVRVLNSPANFRGICAEIDTTQMNPAARQVFRDSMHALGDLRPKYLTGHGPSIFDNGGDGGGNGGI